LAYFYSAPLAYYLSALYILNTIENRDANRDENESGLEAGLAATLVAEKADESRLSGAVMKIASHEYLARAEYSPALA